MCCKVPSPWAQDWPRQTPQVLPHKAPGVRRRRRADLGKPCDMTAFFVTIATTVTIYLLFAGFGRWGVQTSWAITLNYFVAAGLGWTLAGGMPAMGDALAAPWIWPLAALGLAFYPLFRLTAKCSQELGVSVATVSTKLSMAIPVLVFALHDGWSDLGLGQWLGLALAFPAVWLSAMDGTSEPCRPRSPEHGLDAGGHVPGKRDHRHHVWLVHRRPHDGCARHANGVSPRCPSPWAAWWGCLGPALVEVGGQVGFSLGLDAKTSLPERRSGWSISAPCFSCFGSSMEAFFSEAWSSPRST